MDEQVLVVPNTDLADIQEGFSRIMIAKINAIGKNAFFMERSVAEHDPFYRQVIPYCLITVDGKWFTYQRACKETEKRLDGMVSVGVGGHINEVDDSLADFYDTICNCAYREINEEVFGGFIKQLYPVGVIKISKTEVDKVHFGIVLGIVSVDYGVIPKETDRLKRLGFYDPGAVLKNYTNIENWSKLVLQKIAG